MRQLLELYPRIYFACHRRHVRDPRSGGVLSARQGSILDHLDEREAVTVVELARHMGVTASTMSVQVGRLVRTGYVIRERDAEDPRRRNLRLTRSGARMREANSVLDEDRIAEMLERLSPEELEKGMAGLALLAKAAAEITPRESQRVRREEPVDEAEEDPRAQPPEGIKFAGRLKTEKLQTRTRESRQLGKSEEEERGVQEVVQELRRIQQELEEMMGGKKESSE